MDTGIFESLQGFKNTHYGKNSQGQEEPVKKMKPSEKLIHDIKASGFNISQMEPILKTRGDQLVVSCAGSGKTTTMIFKILYDIKSGFATRVYEGRNGTMRIPEKIWVCTFLRSGAEEMPFALKKWQRAFGLADVSEAISFSTLHAEFKRALMQSPFKFNKEIVNSSTNSGYLKNVVKPYQLTNAKGNSLNSEDYNNLESALSYTRNRLDMQRYDAEIYTDLGINTVLIDAILRDWKEERRKNNVVDFDDLQELIYEECYNRNNQELKEFLASRYNFIYIDEFQDTSQVQYAVLKLYTANCKQVFAIGDDDQTIYSWRGSDNNIITKDFPKDYSPVINQLGINYRCPKNILKAIIPSIVHNENRYDKPLESAKEGGVVRYLESHSYTHMVEKLADLVYDDLANKRSVAILCRVNSDGLMPALLFDKIGKFSYSISGDGMTLDSYIGTTVLSIVRLFTERSTPAVKRALNLITWDSYNINKLVDVFRKNKTDLWTIDEDDLKYSCPSIADRLIVWRRYRESKGDMATLKFVLQDYRTRIFIKDSQFNDVVRSTILSIETILEYSHFDSPEDFLYELEEINDRLKGRKIAKNMMVKIATVHEYKGKEADSVYIWNDSEHVFPIKKAEEGTQEMYEEERRVHYIACTRAREISTLVYLKGKPGAFVTEMNLSDAEEVFGSSELSGELTTKLKEEGNLKRWMASAQEDEQDVKDMNTIMGSSIYSPVSEYSDNEFWGADGDSPSSWDSEEGSSSGYIDFSRKAKEKKILKN